MELLRGDESEEEVQLAAGVPWRVLAAWCRDDADPPIRAWHVIELRTEEIRAQRLTEQRKRDGDKDVAYRHKREELERLKQEYWLTAGIPCEPFTHRSSAGIDELQALLDEWHYVAPDRWTEEQFLEVYGVDETKAPSSNSASIFRGADGSAWPDEEIEALSNDVPW